jgi:Xaa-Pro aminopeptidase
MIISRLEKLKNMVKDSNVDALLIEDRINRFYISNFIGTAGIVIVTSKEIYLITDFRYTEKAKNEAKFAKVIEYKKNVYETLESLFNDLNIKTIGIDATKITLSSYNQYSEKLHDIKFIDKSDILSEMRKIKDKDEIENIKKAQEITDKAYCYILNFIKPGISESDIEIELDYFIKRNRASSFSFDIIVASGKRSSLPHGTATNKKIENGDLLTLDFGCIYNEYCSDMTRTIGIGSLDKKSIEIYNIVLNAQCSAIKNIKSGISCKNADEVARRYIEKKGYGKNFGHGLGHGVGLEIHEKPTLSSKSDEVLKEGMIVTIEPGIYIEGFGGVRIEDMGVITREGIDIFTKSNKELIIL